VCLAGEKLEDKRDVLLYPILCRLLYYKYNRRYNVIITYHNMCCSPWIDIPTDRRQLVDRNEDMHMAYSAERIIANGGMTHSMVQIEARKEVEGN
jgi:hypothetical protein